VLVNIGILAAFDYHVAAVALALIPANLIVAALFAQPLRRAFLAERVATAQATTRIEETLASIKTVKAFGREAPESELYAHDNWGSFMAARHARMLFVIYRVIISTIRSLAYVAAIYFGESRPGANGKSWQLPKKMAPALEFRYFLSIY